MPTEFDLPQRDSRALSSPRTSAAYTLPRAGAMKVVVSYQHGPAAGSEVIEVAARNPRDAVALAIEVLKRRMPGVEVTEVLTGQHDQAEEPGA